MNPMNFVRDIKEWRIFLSVKVKKTTSRIKRNANPLTVPRLRPAVEMVPAVCRIYSTSDAKFSGVTSHHFLKFLNFFHNMCNVLSYLP